MGAMLQRRKFAPGCASRHRRRPAVVGGLLVSQLLTLFITPVIFVEMERLSRLLAGLRQCRAAEPVMPAEPTVAPALLPQPAGE